MKLLKPYERADYQNLIKVFLEDRFLADASYYVTYLDKGVDYKKHKKHQKFIEELSKIQKFRVVLCNFKKIKKITVFNMLLKEIIFN